MFYTGLILIRQVIHNPGTIPDDRLNVANTDIRVVFEQAYDYYNDVKDDLEAIEADRRTLSYLFHSVPCMGDSALQAFIDEISQNAAYLYITSLSVNFWNGFGPELGRFCSALQVPVCPAR